MQFSVLKKIKLFISKLNDTNLMNIIFTKFLISTVLILLSIPLSAQQERTNVTPWVAVHDFSVSSDLKKKGVNGWRIAGKLENKLVQKGLYRIVTRAKIAKVLKEKNLNSSSNLEASEFGKMVGSDFIVTGQIQNTGNKIILIGKLIDVSGEAGEVEKSFDISVTGKNLDDAVIKLPGLYDELAARLTMSPGDFLNDGIYFMNQGNYVKAVKAFQEVKRLAPIEKIKEILNNPDLPSFESVTINSLTTPGELLDYGIKEMENNNNHRAAAAFKKFEKITPFEKIKNLFEVGKILKRAEGLARKQKGKINKGIEQAVALFMNAQKNQKDVEKSIPPAELCDKSLMKLEGILVNPKIYLSVDEKDKIENLISKIKNFRDKLFAGPVFGKIWIVPGIKIRLEPIKAGSFEMGEDYSAEEDYGQDNPIHLVNIAKPFWMGKYEVSIGEFLYFLQEANQRNSKSEINKTINWTASYTPILKNYSMKRGKGITWGNKKQPMVGVSWDGAVQFCEWLTRREKTAKRLSENYVYRLPTEAEWEYVCRADSKTKYYFGDETLDLYDYAYYRDNSKRKTSVAGKKKPNKWGIHDMHGNVWEWCYDWYDDAYIAEEVTDPIGSDMSLDNLKVLRGGSFVSSPLDLQSSTRYSFRYKGSKKNVGFRIVCAPGI